MKDISPLLSSASGSLGGTVFTHNKGGQCTRSKVIPTNPKTPLQQAVRAALGGLANMWSTITAPNRATWTAYALAISLPDKLGAMRHISALAHFIRSNAVRLNFIGADKIALNAPVINNIGATPAVASLAAEMQTDGGINFSADMTILDAPAATESDSYALVFLTGPQDPTITFPKVPYNYVDTVNIGTATTQPVTIDVTGYMGNNPAGGQALFAKVEISRADGRLSSKWQGRCITTPHSS